MSNLYPITTGLTGIMLNVNVIPETWDVEDGTSNITFNCIDVSTAKKVTFQGRIEFPDDYNNVDYDEEFIRYRLFNRFKLTLSTVNVFRNYGLGAIDSNQTYGGYVVFS